MPDEADSADRSWLLEPLGPNEVRIHVDAGEGVEVSEEARAALDTLLDELYSGEVEGFATFPRCPSLKQCSGYNCELGKCRPLESYPCFANVNCIIQKLV
jgi:hypothetical protein